jgi:hypothetical protein
VDVGILGQIEARPVLREIGMKGRRAWKGVLPSCITRQQKGIGVAADPSPHCDCVLYFDGGLEGIRTRMRGSDLFTPRDVPVGHFVRVADDLSARPVKRGPSDAELSAFSADDLTLRQIAKRVGLSHETSELVWHVTEFWPHRALTRRTLEPIMNFRQRRSSTYQIRSSSTNRPQQGAMFAFPRIGQRGDVVGIYPSEWVVLRVHNSL